MTHAHRDGEVDVVVLTSAVLVYDALHALLTDVRPTTDPDGARFEVGTIRDTGHRVAIGRGGPEPGLFAEFTERALSLFRPRAVLVVLLGHALRSTPGDVVVADQIVAGTGNGPFIDMSATLHGLARELARTTWWERLPGDASARPAEVRFGTATSEWIRRALIDSAPQEFPGALVTDNGEALEAVSAAEKWRIPCQVIYGAFNRYTTGPDRMDDQAAASAARFAMTLAAEFVPAREVVRQLKTMGHGDRVARTDLLARHAFVESLAELLAFSPPVGDDDLAGPTVIAIEGAWGSGKSTLMDMTRARLERAEGTVAERGAWARLVQRWRQRKLRAWDADLTLSGWSRRRKKADVGAPRVLTAMFNPWSYQTGEHVWAGLNDCIVATGAPVIAKDSSSSLQRFWFAHNVEQLDRRHVQRTLRKRIVSPLLRLGVFALPVPVLTQLVRDPKPLRVFGFDVAPVDLALWIVGVLLGVGLLHTAVRYVCRAADTLLPAELFGPSGAMGAYSAAVGADDPLRDPHRRVRKGQLQSAQEDVHRLIRELGAKGTRLVVFIDDLDRCSPRTTADVFEAVNGFLGGSFPTIRFVLGIDAAATAAHLDAAYSALVVADAGRDSADPSPGWTFLRKLIQLPLPLPRVLGTQVEPLVTGLLGAAQVEPAGQSGDSPAEETPLEETGPENLWGAPLDEALDIIYTAPAVVTLEHAPQVQERFAERLRAQPDLSVREAKRIVTVWMFYVRVLERVSPETGQAAVSRACHLVLLAEIVARWPASQRRLHRRVEGTHALTALAKAVDDNVLWEVELRRFELTGNRHESLRAGMREILRDYDGDEIAKLAEQLT